MSDRWEVEMTPGAEHRTAIHESGHAIAGLLLGRALGCTLFDGGGGATTPETPPDPATAPDFSVHTPERLHGRWTGKPMAAVLDDCAIYAAGRTAEAIICRRAVGPGFVVVDGPDAALIESAAAAALDKYPSIEAVNAWRQLAVACAWRLLRPHADSIRAVAAELLARRSLSAADVAEIHKQVTTRKEPEPCPQ